MGLFRHRGERDWTRYRMREKLFAIGDDFWIENPAKGNVVEPEYEVGGDGGRMAEVSKRWFRIRDTYGIAIAPGRTRR